MDIKSIDNEKDELQRVSQDLKRDEDIDISVQDLENIFKDAEEQELTDDIWDNLENTESNNIEKGQIDLVKKIAKTYDKTDPEILSKALKDDTYLRPLIVKFDGDRYHLVAGNTRLCTAKAIGVTPKVIIADLSDKKSEVDEETGADSSGSSEGPLFSTPILKRDIFKLNNTKEYGSQKGEFKEITDASSSGAFDVPLFGSSPKGRNNPLSIGGPDTIYKGRAVKDKNFPKWGGPDSVFVKVKEKCKKFPYCNQGNTGAIEFISEDQDIKQAIQETSKKTGVPYHKIQEIVLNEINKIFI